MPKVTDSKAKAPVKTTKTARPPSAYNLFMKTELPKVKAANPEMSHKEAFKAAAGNWKSAPENPVNQK